MIRLALSAFALGLTACASAPAQISQSETELTDPAPKMATIPLERLFASPSLSGPSPREVKYSPDGQRVSFLKARADDAARYDLWAFDVSTGEATMLVDSKLLEPDEVELSEEEKAIRERKRIAGSKGIVSYDWGSADQILVPLGGDLHLVTLGESDKNIIRVALLPEAAQHGVTLAQIANRIRQEFFAEEIQRLPREGEEPRLIMQASSTPNLEDFTVVAGDGQAIPLNQVADVELAKLGTQTKARQLTATDAFEYDARVSPGGTYVSFVRDGAVYAIHLESGEETRMTPLAEPENAISYGVAEFVAQEEMSRYTGYWWSPDDRHLAYTRVDESTVDIIPRFEIAADETTVIEQRYPRAGRPNAVVDVFVRSVETYETTEIDWRREDWGPATDQYLARVNWSGTEAVLLQAVNRDQTDIAYIESLLPNDGSDAVTIIAEQQATWVNLSSDFTTSDGARITTNEASGYRHVVELDAGDAFRMITDGDWAVSNLSVVSDESVFFTGFKDTPLERHLYRTPIEPCLDTTPASARATITCMEPTRITEPGKSWSVTVAPDGQSFVGTSSAPNQPPQTGLYNIDGTLITWIEENALDEDHPYAPYLASHTAPEFGTIEAEDGQEMYYSLQLPPNFDETKQYPVILEVYGGPGVQRVTRNWENPIDQFYVQNGYILFRLDNRGSSNRGKAFEDVIYRQMGQPEVRDQLRGVHFLKSLPYVDGSRIAIQGWSYGGYMALMTALQAPEGTFAVAISGAPVSDWSLYDTFYTERYMDTPQDNPEGYEAGSVFPYLENLTTPLLMIHGMADDNVTFDNSTRVYAELQRMGKDFEMMTYPGQRHGIRGEELSTHLMQTRMNFLNRHLKPEGSE